MTDASQRLISFQTKLLVYACALRDQFAKFKRAVRIERRNVRESIVTTISSN